MNRTQGIIASIIAIGLIVGIAILITRKPAMSPAYSVSLVNPGRGQARANPGKHYSNTKQWDITYNEDGLPTKIVKHVDAEIG